MKKKTKVEFICPRTKKIIYKKENTLVNKNIEYEIQDQIYKLIGKKID